MNFKEAYQKMLEGKKVKRKGWEGWQYYKLIGDNMYYANKLIASNVSIENALANDWEIVEETKNKVWKPNIGENYFFITSSLEVNKFTNEGDMVDENVISSDNCFKTEKEAQHMIEKLKVIKELQIFALENNNEKIDWGDKCTDKYFISYDFYDEKIATNVYTFINLLPFEIYFTSKEIAEEAIKTIGEGRIKKYYFDIED